MHLRSHLHPGSFMHFPIVVIIFTITFGYLYLVFIRNKSDGWTNIDTKDIELEYASLGPWVMEQRIVAVFFGLLAVLWFTRADLNFGFMTLPGWSNIFQNPKFLNDGTVAITIADCIISDSIEKWKQSLYHGLENC